MWLRWSCSWWDLSPTATENKKNKKKKKQLSKGKRTSPLRTKQVAIPLQIELLSGGEESFTNLPEITGEFPK
ncbi:hypothetical protein llap_10348 [Limosa lapponica baueri]|uniref:Uncharacterized protein n=1 Tax=Limosa lapponica baueri TaxID=1758121 RepID=A0A2I0TZS4_LIMLA|nr:hypothetical protein llap_10348 [Limosa lapponica baueri]